MVRLPKEKSARPDCHCQCVCVCHCRCLCHLRLHHRSGPFFFFFFVLLICLFLSLFIFLFFLVFFLFSFSFSFLFSFSLPFPVLPSFFIFSCLFWFTLANPWQQFLALGSFSISVHTGFSALCSNPRSTPSMASQWPYQWPSPSMSITGISATATMVGSALPAYATARDHAELLCYSTQISSFSSARYPAQPMVTLRCLSNGRSQSPVMARSIAKAFLLTSMLRALRKGGCPRPPSHCLRGGKPPDKRTEAMQFMELLTTRIVDLSQPSRRA